MYQPVEAIDLPEEIVHGTLLLRPFGQEVIQPVDRAPDDGGRSAIHRSYQRDDLGIELVLEIDDVLEGFLFGLRQLTFQLRDTIRKRLTGHTNGIRLLVILGTLDQGVHLRARTP